jgi:hypothetical protein
MLEPAFVPFADRLLSTTIEFQRHHAVAKDAFAPSARAVAAFRDISADCSLFAFGGGVDVSLWRGWELEEKLFGSELKSHEARDGNVCGDLLNEFGG